MQGITCAIVLFIFACIAYPHLVKNRAQFFAALVLVLLMIVIDAIGQVFTPGGALYRVAYFINAFLQVGAIILLVLSTGGQTFNELTGELGKGFDVIRHGEETAPVVPLTGEQPKPREVPPRPPRKPPPADTSIPMD